MDWDQLLKDYEAWYAERERAREWQAMLDVFTPRRETLFNRTKKWTSDEYMNATLEEIFAWDAWSKGQDNG